ncbi:hypothetical protein F5Y11DRAFT_342796 [Daldinia sp. FL1419]|nr:hypothetical protein F5Y11DRAFT_342796 [Daldinia sp. FL1419]
MQPRWPVRSMPSRVMLAQTSREQPQQESESYTSTLLQISSNDTIPSNPSTITTQRHGSRFDPVFPSSHIRAITIAPSSASSSASRSASSISTEYDGGYVPMGQPSWCARDRMPARLWETQLAATGISQNYGGNIFLPSNQSADVPEHESTSLWLTNLPPNCDHRMLLGSIRNCGKVYATVINPPDSTSGHGGQHLPHTTSASKLVFFDRAGVNNLLAKSQAGEFSVGGYVPKLRMNRIRSAPRDAGPHCRVLHIEGPNLIVNEDFLHAFFTSKFSYEIEDIFTLANNGHSTRQEWRFGSYRCQAESARQSISREKTRSGLTPFFAQCWKDVHVYFGVDPCAPQ